MKLANGSYPASRFAVFLTTHSRLLLISALLLSLLGESNQKKIDMHFKERVTMVKNCGCEKGCQHKIVSVTQYFMVYLYELEAFLETF